MTLTNDQQVAADMFMDFITHPTEKEMILEGVSGSGKSFLTAHLIKLAHQSSHMIKLITGAKDNLTVYCTATTNKAAKILKAASGEEAQTIHSLLGLKVTQNFSNGTTGLRKTGNYQIVHNSLIILDEASMVDEKLLRMIEDSTNHCKILYVGDSFQLLPVFEATCPVFNRNTHFHAMLTEPKRQAKDSPIIQLGDEFRKTITTGIFPKIATVGSTIIKADGSAFQKAVNDEYLRPSRDDDDAKIVAWTNDRVHEYNTYVRKLGTSSEDLTVNERVITNKPIMFKSGPTALPTDETATITSISALYASFGGIEGWDIMLDGNIYVFLPKYQHLAKSYLKSLASEAKKTRDWSVYFQMQDHFADLRPIHASTTHKAQGSTYGTVFIDLPDIARNHKASEVARLLYVATTRAASKVWFYGELPEKYGG